MLVKGVVYFVSVSSMLIVTVCYLSSLFVFIAFSLWLFTSTMLKRKGRRVFPRFPTVVVVTRQNNASLLIL